METGFSFPKFSRKMILAPLCPADDHFIFCIHSTCSPRVSSSSPRWRILQAGKHAQPAPPC